MRCWYVNLKNIFFLRHVWWDVRERVYKVVKMAGCEMMKRRRRERKSVWETPKRITDRRSLKGRHFCVFLKQSSIFLKGEYIIVRVIFVSWTSRKKESTWKKYGVIMLDFSEVVVSTKQNDWVSIKCYFLDCTKEIKWKWESLLQ